MNKQMISCRRVCVTLWMALCALAWAGPAASIATPAADPTALATVDSLVELCAAMPRGNADAARQQLGHLEQGSSTEDLAQLRNSEAYQAAWRSVTDMLAKVDPSELRKVCAVSDAPGH